MAHAHMPRLPRFSRPWAYLALVAVAWLVVASAAWWLNGRSLSAEGRFEPFGEVSTVHFQGAAYATNTEVLRLSAPSMTWIGRTQEGYHVFAQRIDQTNNGGGGGGPAVGMGGNETGPVFLQTPDGRFVPLVRN